MIRIFLEIRQNVLGYILIKCNCKQIKSTQKVEVAFERIHLFCHFRQRKISFSKMDIILPSF